MLLKWQENTPDSSANRRATAHTAPAFSPASRARPSFLYSTQWCADTSRPKQSTFPRAPRNSTQIRSSQEDSSLTPKSSWHYSLFLSLSCSDRSPFLTVLQNPAPQAKTPSPYVTGFLILSFPNPRLLHTQPQCLNFCFPPLPTITSQIKYSLLTSFTASFPHFLSPSLSTSSSENIDSNIL